MWAVSRAQLQVPRATGALGASDPAQRRYFKDSPAHASGSLGISRQWMSSLWPANNNYCEHGEHEHGEPCHIFRSHFTFTIKILNTSKNISKIVQSFQFTHNYKSGFHISHTISVIELHASDNRQAHYTAFLKGFLLKINYSNEHFWFQFCIYVT
jgi:hypothetical protein